MHHFCAGNPSPPFRNLVNVNVEMSICILFKNYLNFVSGDKTMVEVALLKFSGFDLPLFLRDLLKGFKKIPAVPTVFNLKVTLEKC